MMISLTGRGHRDSLGTVNGGGDGFKESIRGRRSKRGQPPT